MTTDSQPCRFPPDNIVQADLNADAKMSRNHIFVGRRLFFAKKYVLFLQLRFNWISDIYINTWKKSENILPKNLVDSKKSYNFALAIGKQTMSRTKQRLQ